MARSKNLRAKVINQFLDAIQQQYLRSPLPSQSALADMYNISRTTVRHVLEYLVEKGILEDSDNNPKIIREPSEDDFLDILVGPTEKNSDEFESIFYRMIQQHILKPGSNFTELQLAKYAHVHPTVVREFLLKFSRYNLIENQHRGVWHLKIFEQKYAEELFELRELLETFSLSYFMKLPPEDNRWVQAKELLFQHKQLRDSVINNYRAFSELDRKFHHLLLSAADNRFVEQALDLVTIIFHFHYQWDNKDLRERNILAIEEHMIILNAIINHNEPLAMQELRNHLNTAKLSMIRSLKKN
ncbi:GntR family transcriptional regulator [Klebsiella sp. BIGb0407]|uniref:GntR family transcriptional regulator n=1 Tax=Klebsiella sp. BIGb0407 TaxID=2940603 RepID=UPI00216911BD|nr:GntR family transcriptional regulator [Klebsiella sp. BIGb0407]MCS3431252.1 DNA-binding GntR family transcriptional regulator [Klebsiella sp. BIGb0407]